MATKGEGGPFIVDTGASDVAVPAHVAAQAGIVIDRDTPRATYQTANGTVYGAPIRLGHIVLGGVVVEDVRATVTDGDLAGSLLGMSFLRRLAGYDVSAGTLTLRQ